MIYLPTTIGFVSKEEDLSYNGNMTNQHPINNGKKLVNYPGADYTNFCTRQDFENFDYNGYCNNPVKNKPRLLKKDKDVILFQQGRDRYALCPVN